MERGPRAFAVLEAVDGEERFFLDQDRVLLGRGSPAEGIRPEVDLGPLDPEGSVSRRHARILREADSVLLEDQGSSNGTYLNDDPLVPGVQRPLRDGDRIRLGAVRLVYRIRG